MPKFYHITLIPQAGVSESLIERKMDTAVDWFRYSKFNWIVWTTSDAAKWAERLSELVKPDGTLFICRLDVSDRRGWMDKSFWTWLRKKIAESKKPQE